MGRHVLSDEDVDDIFRNLNVISLASATRNSGKRKAIEYHLNLADLSNSFYVVTWAHETWAHDKDTVRVIYKGSDRVLAVAKYNELDA
tara:strand:+ start:2810 stop:3073 length:264 start_codon:yes stop_codon:yes gene_type:complete